MNLLLRSTFWAICVFVASEVGWAQGKNDTSKTEVVVEAESVPENTTTPAPVKAPTPANVENEQSFNVKLRNIEERVNELKEKIFQSKARLIQLQEVVLQGSISGAKAVLIHRNEMGSSFKLRRVQYSLDGAPVLNRMDSGDGDLENQQEIEIFNGSIAPGNHQISVLMEYQGYGYGIFSYLRGYKFKIKSSYTFDAPEGKQTTIRIVGFEKGGITTELKDRPSIRYDIEAVKPLSAENAQPTNAEGPVKADDSTK